MLIARIGSMYLISGEFGDILSDLSVPDLFYLHARMVDEQNEITYSCHGCGAELVAGFNWTNGDVRRGRYICCYCRGVIQVYWSTIYRERRRIGRIVATQRRNAWGANLSADFTVSQWRVAKAHFGDACAYCGMTDVPLQQEHVVPVVDGGGYTVKNIVPVCQRCNDSKQGMSLADWVSGRGSSFVLSDVLSRVDAYFASLDQPASCVR